MLFMKRKTEEFHFTPEQEACLANCRQLTNDELRVLNGGGSYKGMPSSVQMQQGLSGGSSNNDSSSSSGTSKGHNGMPSDVEAMLEHSGSSSATETSSNAGQTTITTVAYPAQPATQPSAPKPTESEPAVNHGTGSASGSGSTNNSSASASSSTNNSSPSASTPGSCAGNGSSPFPKPYAGAYEHGSYAEAQIETEKQKTQEVQDEQVPQAVSSEVRHFWQKKKEHGICILVDKRRYQWDNQENIFIGADYSNEFVNQVTDALVYLKKSSTASEIISSLSNDDNCVTIRKYDIDRHYMDGFGYINSKIYFNPTTGLRLNETVDQDLDSVQSPAINLLLELIHAQDNIVYGTYKTGLTETLQSDLFPNMSEFRAVGRSNIVAYELGEPVRYSYRGTDSYSLPYSETVVTSFRNYQNGCTKR